jgi:N-acetylmuramoyl-L-alanine amidase
MANYSANIIPNFRLHSLKRLLVISIVFALLLTYSPTAFAQDAGKISTIVIDAGHGGKDPGALGSKSKEKDIALAVALKTGHYIEQHLKGVKVVYTRRTDKFVELHKRGQIANKANADLFISIHCNANNSHSPYGAETYVLGVEEKRTKANMEVAMTENASIMLEENQGDSYDGFNPDSPESLIGLTLFQSEHLDASLQLADKIQKQFKNRVGRKDRGVHQAGFLVLWRTAMPSVLVELGYLSNVTEEAFLRSEKGQTYMASAIFRAVKEYKREYESENGVYNYRKEAINETPANKTTTQATTKKEINDKGRIIFRVQFYTSPKQLSLSDKRFKALLDIYSYEHNGMYKYTSGIFSTLTTAEQHKKTVRSKGFNDAFTVAFYDGARISISEAKKILNEK